MTRHAAVACLVALVAAGAAGCASSGTSSASAGSSSKAAGGSPAASGGTSAASDPLAALSADAIGNKASADTFAATSVHVAGTGSDSGTPFSLALTIGRSSDCEGTFSEGAKGSFQLILIGKTVWVKPNDTFWKVNGGTDSSVLSILAGKWIEDSSGGSGLGSLSTMCSLSGMFGSLKSTATDLTKGTTSTVDGQRVLSLTQSGQAGTVYVSDTADPVIVRMAQPGAGGGSVDLTEYGAPFSVTAPPASQTLSGKDYGF